MHPTVHVTQILSPFDRTKRTMEAVEYSEGKTVLEYLTGPVKGDFVASVNGQMLNEDEVRAFVPKPGDFIVACPVLQGGGGGGKSVLRVVAMVAIAVVAPQVAASVAPELIMAGVTGTLTGGTLTAMLSAGMVAAGGMLVNAVLPPGGTKKADSSNSASYGIDGAKNTSQEGVVRPLVYGNFRWGGNVIGNYTVTDKDDNQTLYMLINCGEGPVAAPTDWLIDGQKPEDVKAEVIFLDGSDSVNLASKVPYFGENITPMSQSWRTTPDWKTFTFPTEIDRVRFDFVWPSGLYHMDKNNTKNQSTGLHIQYRLIGSSTWLDLPLANAVTSFATTTTWQKVSFMTPNSFKAYKVWKPTGHENTSTATKQFFSTKISTTVITCPDAYMNGCEGTMGRAANGEWIVGTTGVYGVAGASVTVTAAKKSAVRRSFESVPLPEGQYEFRICRSEAEAFLTDTNKIDTCLLADINLITTEDVRLRNTAAAVIKVPLGDQISGMPTVTHRSGGKIIRVWDETLNKWVRKASNNPAWVAFDILSNTRYGGCASDSRFILDDWRELARYCDSNSLAFNGVFDSETNVWDAATKVLRCGHAQIIRVGTRYGLAIERPSDPAMMFTVGNIISGSFEQTWTSSDERANVIEGTFYDEANNFTQRTMRVADADSLASGKPERVASLDLMGVTNEDQAWLDLNILLNSNKYIHQSIKFDALIDSIGCQIGEVVLVQHDQPSWGDGGRTEAGSSASTVLLDRPVSMTGGTSYSLLLHFPSVQRYAGTVASVTAAGYENILLLNGFDGGYNVSRIVLNGTDYEVTRVVQSGSSWGVCVDIGVSVAAGATYQLWQNDAIEVRTVQNTLPAGTTVDATQVTVTSAFPGAPAIYTNWMFGENQRVAKPFRVKAISGTQDYTRTITAVEYNPSVWTLNPKPTPNYSDLPTGVDQVVIDSVTEQNYREGSFFRNEVTVHFHSTQETYAGSHIWYRLDGGEWVQIPDGVTSASVNVSVGYTIEFKVVAFNGFGKTAPDAGAPISAPYTVTGITTGQAAPTGVGFTVTASGIKVVWDAYPDNSLWTATTLKIGGTTWENATLLNVGKATSFTIPFQAASSYTIRLKHQTTVGESPETTYTIPVLAPNTPSILTASSTGLAVSARWLSAQTTQPIKAYYLKAGTSSDTAATATDVAQTDGKTLTATFNSDPTWTKLFVIAEDVGGNVTSAGSISFTAAAITGAKVVTLSSSAQVFKIDKTGAGSPASITLTANGQNCAGSPTFTVASGTATLTGTGNSRSIALASMTTDAVVVNVSWDGQTDTYTIVKVREGTDAITAVLSNESAAVPADASGTVTSFAGASTKLTIYVGATDDTANWTITTTASNCTISGANTASVSVSAMSADAATVTFSATKAGATVTKVFSLVKSKQGAAGANGADGGYTDYRFIRSVNQPSTPTVANPSGWYDAPPTGGDPLWMIKAAKNAAGTLTSTWSAPVRLDADSIFVEYSADASTWHATFTTGDKYMHTKTGVNGTWSSAIKIVGENGATGPAGANGQRGNLNLVQAVTATTWSNATAATAIANAGGGSPMFGDVVTEYNSASSFSDTRVFNGTNWVAISSYLSGNMFVNGSIVAQKIDSRGLSIKDASGNIILAAGTGLDYTQYVANAPQSTGNMVFTSDFTDGSGTWLGRSVEAVTGQAWGYALVSTTRDTLELKNRFQVTPGETLYVEADLLPNGTQVCAFGARFDNADGTTVIAWLGATSTATAAWQHVSGTVTVPANAAFACPWFQLNGTGTMAKAYLANPWIGRAQRGATYGATFGVNISGQITASNASTYIANAAIGAAQIGSLNAGVITAGTLDAARIGATSITTDKLVVGAVSAAQQGAYQYNATSIPSTSTSFSVSPSSVITMTSTGAPVKYMGTVNVSTYAPNTTATYVTIVVSALLDGSGSNINPVVLPESGITIPLLNKRAQATLPLAVRCTPSAGSHTWSVQITISFYNGSGTQVAASTSASTSSTISLFTEENKV